MKVIGIIPSRYGSSRFPGKSLALIGGRSLIQRTFESASRCTALDRLVVATDDQRIFDHAKQFGAEVVMTSTDCPTGTDRLVEVIEKERCFDDTSLIVNIQGDEPLIEEGTIRAVIEALKKDPTAVMSTAVFKAESEEDLKSHSVRCVMDCRGYALYFSRALIPSNKLGCYQKAISYYNHLGIYAYRRDFLLKYAKLPATPLQIAEDLEQLKVLEHGYPLKVAIVEKSHSIGVDTPEDIIKVENYLCKQNIFLSQGESVPL
jgi:3-deoxy-manno-octulosonate cytidylyltransferase (CMP-KDO synthetase)